MNNKLKQIIFDKLYEDLKHVEIIPYYNDIWFIDRKEKYWYLEYKESGYLWWRWQFFSNFFPLFSMEYHEYQLIISEWVEEVLNCKVMTPHRRLHLTARRVEEVLNCKVMTPFFSCNIFGTRVEEVLNCKVMTPFPYEDSSLVQVEAVLNCKVITPAHNPMHQYREVEAVLNCKIN
jgi:hypothetical protein